MWCGVVCVVYGCGVCARVVCVHVWCVCIDDLGDTQRLSYLLWVTHAPDTSTDLIIGFLLHSQEFLFKEQPLGLQLASQQVRVLREKQSVQTWSHHTLSHPMYLQL